MPRLTITLSEERHRALKEAAVRRRKSIAALIEESLELYGIKSIATAAELVARSRARAGFDEADALLLANEETQAVRNR
jgi:predicted transcriptional regulator